MDKHGEVSFDWKGDVLVIEVSGYFNEQGIKHYAPLLQESILEKDLNSWKRIEVWDDEALGCPETLALAKEIYNWYEENGCIAIAVVISNVVQKHVIESVFKSSAEIFFEKSEAIDWLEKQ